MRVVQLIKKVAEIQTHHKHHERLGEHRIKYRPRVIGAFTIIELLVVIGIITVLLGILLPVLTRARFHANELQCVSNMRQLVIAQLAYTDNNQGRFPEHRDSGSNYAREPAIYNGVGMPGAYTQANVWYVMTDYLRDPAITICPLTVDFDPAWSSSTFSDPTQVSPDRYGGWDTSCDYIDLPYIWTPNWIPTGNFVVGSVVPLPGERAWPIRRGDCTADTPMITHAVGVGQNPSGVPPHNAADWGHNGIGRYDQAYGTQLNPNPRRSNPVAYGDGHVEVHQDADIRARVTTNSGGLGIAFY